MEKKEIKEIASTAVMGIVTMFGAWATIWLLAIMSGNA